MAEAYDYAEAHGYDYFTTVMTVSRQKDSQIMNQIGEELSKTHTRTKYFFSDFKKNNGQMIGVQIRKKYDLYNQVYCGCVYSYQEMLQRPER
jgi:predicted adenine nucleotide alpha hydrolase (AANH) superfamily ATPase